MLIIHAHDLWSQGIFHMTTPPRDLPIPASTPRYWEQWNHENKDAIAAYNGRVAREGLPLARYRTFLKKR